MIIIKQGTTNNISLPLNTLFAAEQLKNIVAIEVAIGTKNKQAKFHWYSYDFTKSTALYEKNSTNIKFSIPPAQSNQWNYQVPIQVRVKDKNSAIMNSPIFYAYIQTALSAEDF